MEIVSLNTIFIIAFFIPGYIFIHTKDYFLLKCEKSQFEKTIQGLIASLVIWGVFLLIKHQPFNEQKEAIINVFILFKFKNNEIAKEYLIQNRQIIIKLLLLVCLYSFFLAIIYSLVRKNILISNLIHLLTRRDYFERVKIRFFFEGINGTIIVSMKNGKRYLGILEGAIDQEKDNHIILSDPYIIEEKEIVKLFASKLLINMDDVDLIELNKGELKHGK
ncbi:MAG: DUF6338 family protein [Treponema sp.]|nr:DUF6338 family protein [Treponema sp.]